MANIKQIDANRRNSQLSTGPVTPEGKQHVALNALKSGIYAESTVIPGEDPTELLNLTGEYYFHHRPASPEGRALVDSLVHADWILRRLRHSEAAVHNCDCPRCETRYAETSEAATISGRLANELSKLDHIQRRINATERNFHRSLKALQTLELSQAPPQPIETEATSEKLASFPQIQKTPGGAAAAPPLGSRLPNPCSAVPPAPDPQPQVSKTTSEKLASFPQNQKMPSSEAVEPMPEVQFEPEIDAA